MSRPRADHEVSARAALSAYGRSGDAPLRLLGLSENATWLVDDERPMVLRVHRPGYHTRAEVESELDWVDALRRDTRVRAPETIPTLDGRRVIEVTVGGVTSFVDAAALVAGVTVERAPGVVGWQELGELTAVMHEHALGWERPPGFSRFSWDLDDILGPDARWGDWRDAPGLADLDAALIERAAGMIGDRLDVFGRGRDRFGLVHADLGPANLIVDPQDPTAGITVLDFDDCGWSWLLVDLASVVGVVDDTPETERIIAGWLRGYLAVRALPAEHLSMVPTFVMLRRIHLTAWVGSHLDATGTGSAVTEFTSRTARLAARYLGDPGWLRDATSGST